MKRYRCLEAFEWRGNQYIPGLEYMPRDDEAHAPMRAAMPGWVREGKFLELPGEHNGAAASGVATVGKKE